ncbi:MAG: hypothetical protein CYPHOPRED_001821 [Cyphobasidiales sp. Tagirdzhanova-0007]|nr:MAG: hypothetical protein CYPHOPRED_001821 [Cyphobasidiales sp. Tagirdzhanova-0007]
MASPLGSYAHLLPPSWKSVIAGWLAEDTPSFDYGGFVVGETEEEAFLLGKKAGILAGAPFFEEIFKQLDCLVTWHFKEGDTFAPSKESPKVKVATVRGKARHLLLGERVALNTLARCSGIATQSRRLADKAKACGWTGIIAGTRKTTPGFRLVEKYGMLVGGVDPHRYDLSSMVMLKDNHIWSKGVAVRLYISTALTYFSSETGSIPKAVQAARSVCGFSLRIDVECTSEQEAIQAIEAGADVIMLDNFTSDQIQECCSSLKQKYGQDNVGNSRRKWLIEVSGGVTPENFEEHVHPDVDIISTSSIHQSVQHIDFSLKISPKNKPVADTSDAL